MSLQTSPISGVPMRQVSKYGVEIDVCPTSGGVWLDRSELEKIVAMIREQEGDERSRHLLSEWEARSPQSSRGDRHSGDYDSDNQHRPSHNKHKNKKKGKLSELIDLFDM